MRTIFINLWKNRKANAWLFVELIIVTILTWVILDPAIVSYEDSKLDVGYDADRLAVIELTEISEDSPDYDTVYSSDVAKKEAFNNIIYKLRSLEDVESATYCDYQVLNSTSLSTNDFSLSPEDTLPHPATFCMNIYPNSDFFKTYGIKAIEGAPNPDSVIVTGNGYQADQIILTETYAKKRFPDEKALGKKWTYTMEKYNYSKDYEIYTIVEDHEYATYAPSYAMMYSFVREGFNRFDDIQLVARLKEGVSPADFAARIAADPSVLNTGNFRVRITTDYLTKIRNAEESRGVTNTRRLAMTLAIFFLFNLVLGVIGTITLQTRRRVAEMGIRRCYGATGGRIVWMLLGEALVLATISFIIGDLLYLQYAWSEGLSAQAAFDFNLPAPDTWYSSFGGHFAGVSLIVWLILMVCVAIGAAIPAIRAAQVNPIDALRDE